MTDIQNAIPQMGINPTSPVRNVNPSPDKDAEQPPPDIPPADSEPNANAGGNSLVKQIIDKDIQITPDEFAKLNLRLIEAPDVANNMYLGEGQFPVTMAYFSKKLEKRLNRLMDNWWKTVMRSIWDKTKDKVLWDEMSRAKDREDREMALQNAWTKYGKQLSDLTNW